ncbi:MAG: prolyl oligopeptidase family serine peptidase [Phycisphaerales bacterium]
MTPTLVRAQGSTTYKTPPAAIKAALEAPPLPAVSLDPTRRTMVLIDRVSLPPIADLAAPMLRLAGDRYNPRTNGSFGPRVFVGYVIKDIASGKERRVELPADSDLSGVSWSPDGSVFAFTRTTDSTIELWVCDVASAKAKKLGGGLNEANGAPLRWMPDGKRLLCRFIPGNRGPMPVAPAAPGGPVIQESAGVTAQVRTYQDLLTNSYDEVVWDWLMTTQPAFVDITSGERKDFGAPANYGRLDPSPDGKYLLVSVTQKPYSYAVPAGLFPETNEVWSCDGQPIAKLCTYPLREDIPIEGVQKGPRGYQWRDTADATLVYAEALDDGDPKNKVAQRDQLFVLGAPFSGAGTPWFKTEHRFTGISWMDACPETQGVGGGKGMCMVSEYDRDRRWSRTWLYDADALTATPRLVWDRSVRDRYNAPGTPLTTRLANGRSVVRVLPADGAVSVPSVYLAGQGAGPEGDRPFLDRMPLSDFTPVRLWRNEGECYESVIDVLADGRVMTSYETRTEVPNYFIRDLGKATRSAVTAFVDPVPALRRVKKELVKYARADGVELSATMYTPDGWDKSKGALPMLVWAYPLEFNDKSTAGQVSGSPYRFTSIGGLSHLFMLTQGYAVMDEATMPIVGDPETMNDTFIEQISQSAQAAIDKAVEMGVADRDRVAVGGHSYGAFMTANLLAHTTLFKAGIARSGAYNRTLTPFGFQGERRTYWEARDTYERLSPFTFADKIKAPLLMTHGQLDSNPGTFPVQSERLYAAIKGNGGTVRLVLLPYEDHGYSAKESVFQVQAEMVEWLDTWVKPVRGAGPS